MAGYTRVDTINNIADGNVINAADLDGEFDGVQAAFNSSTGHNHDGTAGEGAPILALGPAQDVTISTSVLGVKTTNTVDLGTNSLKFKDFYLAGAASVGGTLGVTGVATLTAQPVLSSLTASQAVFTDASKGLVSNAITGTGNVVMSASPTLTGTLGAAAATFSGAVTLGDASADAITVNGTITSNLIFTDNTYDIGASGATRPRTGYFGTSVISPLVDATNLEVTNLKALDGTAAGSIANSTGVVTLASSVLTTTDINGGTIDGTAIGGSTAAAGAFTTLSATGVTTVQAGTVSAPAITTTGDTNTGIFFPAADTIAFAEGGVEPARIDASGNMGLGVTPSAWGSGRRVFQMGTSPYIMGSGTSLELLANAYFNGTDWIYNSNGATSYYALNAGAHTWYNAASGTAGNTISFTTAMTLDASGQLLLGATSNLTTARRELVMQGSSGALVSLGNNSTADRFQIASDSSENALLNNKASTPMIFYTAATERARITSGGAIWAGNTTRQSTDNHTFIASVATGDWTTNFQNNAASGAPLGILINYSAIAPNGTGSMFIRAQDSSATRFDVRSNGGIANYSANNANLSDLREKTNFAPAKSYLDTICAIPVQTFNYIDQNLEEDGGLTLGVVAQDVQAVAPEMVMESNWGTEEEPKMRLSIYQTDLQYALMKCIQELKAIVDAQAVEIAALKGTP